MLMVTDRKSFMPAVDTRSIGAATLSITCRLSADLLDIPWCGMPSVQSAIPVRLLKINLTFREACQELCSIVLMDGLTMQGAPVLRMDHCL